MPRVYVQQTYCGLVLMMLGGQWMVIDSLTYLLGSHATVSLLHILHLQVAVLEYRLIPTYLAQLWQNFEVHLTLHQNLHPRTHQTYQCLPATSLMGFLLMHSVSLNTFLYSLCYQSFEIPEVVYSSCIHGPVTIFPKIPSARNCNKMLMFLKSFTSDLRKAVLLLQLFSKYITSVVLR